MTGTRKTRVLNCRVTPENETALADLAALHGLTKSEVVRRLVVNAAANPEPVLKGKAPARP